MFANLAALPDLATGPPDPLITAAAAKFAADSRLDQLGAVRPEPSLCFIAGQMAVIRDSWGAVLGRILITEIQ